MKKSALFFAPGFYETLRYAKKVSEPPPRYIMTGGARLAFSDTHKHHTYRKIYKKEGNRAIRPLGRMAIRAPFRRSSERLRADVLPPRGAAPSNQPGWTILQRQHRLAAPKSSHKLEMGHLGTFGGLGGNRRGIGR